MPGKAASRSSTDGNAVNGDTANTEATIKARLSRKRTKTGCLTCRKRRIKCGEERPMCKNCIKSRRHCEGYIQRVVFKQPTFEYIHQYSGDTPFALHNTSESVHNASNQPTTPLAYPNNPTLVAQHYYTSGTPAHEFTQPYTVPITNTTQIPFRQISPHTQHDLYQQIPAFVPPLPYTTVPATTSFNATSNLHQSWQNHAPNQWNTSQAPFPSLVPVDSAVYHDYWHLSPTGDTTKQESGSNVLLDKSSPSAHSESRSLDFAFADEYRSAVFHPDVGPTQMLRAAAVEIADDDYFDVQSDDEMDVDSVIGHKQAGERQDGGVLSIVQQLNAVQQMQLRSYDTFLSQGMLDTYRPEMVANPLRNEATGRVFLHFISATGPSLSPFERNTTTSATLFNNIEVPVTQRGIWTYTMPMAALHNQGLLHAMLALASLHIARLQGGSITPSIQHYAWSLKRIHNAVANKKKRLQLTTIAASMLLGFYEIMTAEHSKWNTHLAGAKQLILETDFAGMLRQFDTLKQHRRARLANGVYKNEAPSVDDITLDSIPNIDQSTVSQFFGQEVRYAQQGFVQSEWTGSLPRLDLSKFEILKDLFWWYCKQDAYQSIISGNPLLMDYSRWAECPPRAPIGRVDAVYGSFDHLTLLLGRVADFGAKDKIRKLRDMELNGGTWKPHPASKMARAAPPPTKVPAQTAPLFFGMAPAPTSKVRMPSSYKSLDGQISPSFEKESWDIETALAEHDRIRKALADFRSSLGPAFEPVYENGHARAPTAFGPPLIYRTYDIGCLMAIYNMTVIIAIRSHPYYHPAAHVAAGMAARDTAVYANDVGRIAAGIVPGPLDVPVNPNLGAALVESCMPSFFAAVQYQQADQRYETVSRIFNIARRTGWGTADLIANGCETSWVRAAEAGRGPSYERIVRSQLIGSSDSRLTGDYELQDPNGQPDEHDQVDRRFVKEKAVARLHWAIGIMGTENDI